MRGRKGWVILNTPYDRGFVDDLKFQIPSSSRKWDVVAKVWEVEESYLQEVVEMCSAYFDEVFTDLVEPETPIDSIFVKVFEICPKDNRDKLYAALAFAFHPDRGGNNEAMTQINSAYKNST